jgi:hypothetical protein
MVVAEVVGMLVESASTTDTLAVVGWKCFLPVVLVPLRATRTVGLEVVRQVHMKGEAVVGTAAGAVESIKAVEEVVVVRTHLASSMAPLVVSMLAMEGSNSNSFPLLPM